MADPTTGPLQLVTGQFNSLAPGFFLHLCLHPDDETQLQIQAVIPAGTWLGIVLGDSGMAAGADMIVFNSETLKA